MNLPGILISLFDRDLERLRHEIESFSSDNNLWQTSGSVSNSAGNLCLHLTGNLNHFIGTIIGKTGFIRDREAEFNRKNLSKNQLLEMIGECGSAIRNTLQHMPESLLNEKYPVEVFGYPMTHEYFMIHLISHLNYHLGQINYLRRIIDAP